MIVILIGIVGGATALAVTTYRVIRSRIAAAGLLFAVAALVVGIAFQRFPSWEAVPLSDAIGRTGQVGDRAFQVSLAGPYEVVIAVERVERRESPLARSFQRSSPIDLDWRILHDDSEIASGNSQDAARAHYGGAFQGTQIIGYFDAKPEVRYTLQYEVNDVPVDLVTYHPVIRIQSDNRSEPFHSSFYFFPTLFWAGIGTATMGVGFLGWAVYGSFSSGRTERSAG